MEDECSRIDAQVSSLNKELAELISIVNDENLVVKAVREAEERMSEIQNEIDVLQNRKSSVVSRQGLF